MPSAAPLASGFVCAQLGLQCMFTTLPPVPPRPTCSGDQEAAAEEDGFGSPVGTFLACSLPSLSGLRLRSPQQASVPVPVPAPPQRGTTLAAGTAAGSPGRPCMLAPAPTQHPHPSPIPSSGTPDSSAKPRRPGWAFAGFRPGTFLPAGAARMPGTTAPASAGSGRWARPLGATNHSSRAAEQSPAGPLTPPILSQQSSAQPVQRQLQWGDEGLAGTPPAPNSARLATSAPSSRLACSASAARASLATVPAPAVADSEDSEAPGGGLAGLWEKDVEASGSSAAIAALLGLPPLQALAREQMVGLQVRCTPRPTPLLSLPGCL